MTRLIVKLWCTALALALFASLEPTSEAHADASYAHVVRSGETLASIAQRYYGDPRRESVIVAENGLDAQGGAPIVRGLRLRIPFVTYHRVAEGETWQGLAERFLGSPRRAFALIAANEGTASEQPPVGAELLIPYPLRHVTTQSENLPRVATLYFGDDAASVRNLRRYNGLRGIRLSRGQLLLIPLADLVLSEEGRHIIEEETGVAPPAGDVRAMQAQVSAELPTLRAHVRGGRFTEAVALGNRLLGTGVLTGNQVVSIQRELGTAYVALARADLAVDAFGAAIARQPDLQLDQLSTSPIVLEAFQQAQVAHRAARTAEAIEEGADAGEALPSAD